MPEIDGKVVVFAGTDPTTAVGPEVAWLEPDGFVAVTVTSSVEPTSEACAVYVDEVAPEIAGPQLAPF